ncbi:DEKNAAC105686 [Brettanomyces naardenensis]|uniref:DEKNAAC105686 n=1 Tax=Brettanomyces naardenensis TaxID=13370 RepID=A0A448YU15_BRENA|nr:DEKNAAC105686 [Brettanomyces naardenensis]
MYDQMMELYGKTQNLIGYIEYEVLRQELDKYNDYQYQFFRLKERFQDLKVEFRRAQLISKQQELDAIYKQIEDEEDEVEKVDNTKSDGYLDDEKLEDLSKQQQILGKNKQITDKLQNIATMMNNSLIASERNLQDLGSSSSLLTDLGNRYAYFADVLMRTNGLVKMVNESSNAERRQIYRAIYFFIAVCTYIVYKRILKRPVKLFIWLFYNFFRYAILGGKKIADGVSRDNTLVPTIIATEVTPGTEGTEEPNLSFANDVVTTIIESIISTNTNSMVRDEL